MISKILHLDGKSQHVVGQQVRSIEYQSFSFDEAFDHEISLEAFQTTKASNDRFLVNDFSGCRDNAELDGSVVAFEKVGSEVRIYSCEGDELTEQQNAAVGKALELPENFA